MVGPDAIGTLTQLLWMSPQDKVYALLDGASIPSLLERLYGEKRPPFECLFPGELEPDMAEVAPYLVELDRGSDFAEWVMGQGWGNHWGIFAVSQADLRTVYFHLRTLSVVYTPESRPMLFRYYDPRVMRLFLTTCAPEQIKQLFGPVERFVAEGETATAALTFTHVNGEPQTGTRQIPLR
ncbi:MAG TPA: DUF4123 domain-containing protein [Burkholderiales bacterium]|nr:DUF4123 domain-containing protein [Burkholderiales bacterium]